MAEEVAQAKSSPIIEKMAAKYGLTTNAFLQTLVSEVFPREVDKKPFSPSAQQIASFLVVADQYNLNPFTKEIWPFPAKGTLIPTVSVDGWSRMINEHPSFDGMEFADKFNESGNIEAITCTIHRRDRQHPTSITEYLKECRRSTAMWDKWPVRMLRWKSLIQTARMAFGFAGVFEKDEVERITGGEVVLAAAAATATTLKDKIAAAMNKPQAAEPIETPDTSSPIAEAADVETEMFS